MSTDESNNVERVLDAHPAEGQYVEGHVVGADHNIYTVHPLPEITTPGYRFGQLIEPLSDYVRPGAIAKTSVYGSVAVAGLLSLRRRDTAPLRAIAQGHLTGAVATSLLSLIAHRVAPHGSAEIEPQTPAGNTEAGVSRPIFEILRFGTAVIGGVQPNRAVAMHRIHHRFTDTPLDPHSPKYHGRFPVFFGLTGITRQTERSNQELVEAEQVDYRSRKRFYDGIHVALPAIVTSHLLLGRALGIPLKYRLLAAGVQVTDAYLLNATFTADAHMSGAPKDINMGLLSPLFPEEYHQNHHLLPRDPRHARIDPPFGFLRFLKRIGQARIPGEHYHDAHGNPHFQEHKDHHVDGIQVQS